MIRIKLPTHKHPLYPTPWGFYHPRCNFCGGGSRDMYYYRCSLCSLNFEIRCSMLALEIDYPYHPKHPLKILTKEEHHFSDGKCLICGEELRLKFYHCSICKFSVDVGCVRDPPPLTILFPKAHEHQLSLTPRKISFHCDACGIPGDRSPYSCQQCYFMIHQSCIDLPEIINVNRHEHRLSRRLHLSPGSWVCRFCHKNVDWSYGAHQAYSCSICPNYVIHSQCAIRYDVWDKLELKGIPEEPQDIEPFKVSSILTFNTSVLMLSVPQFLNLSSMKVIHAPCTTITTRIWNALLAINGTVNCLVAMTAALE
ncbi:unnamed protein product [Brassica napus]|uniref:(rape) hypothetical protein n=1 Tax=Brassica napus TaxID=3708 RepID=A0A816R782_BRANA|nr:unnamed protein product [Brassica napus]